MSALLVLVITVTHSTTTQTFGWKVSGVQVTSIVAATGV